MYPVEMYVQVRRACMVEGMSVREASRVFGLHRDTVRKMPAYSVPPGYRREGPPRRPKLEPFTGVIDAILEGDSRVPRKQRHTAKRVFERLKDEYGFDGQYTIVKDYVRERGRRTQDMFVPLSHAPGHAQCDFGEAVAIVAGVERKVHYFVLDLPHSDGCFVKAYPAETTEAFLDGHVSAFALLENTGEYRVAARAGDGREAVRLLREAVADVVVMGVRAPVSYGMEACREITERFPDTKVLMGAAPGEPGSVEQSLAAGAAGYLFESRIPAALVRCGVLGKGR